MSRQLARAWALAGGYFWLPCPVCGQEFGGQEWRSVDGLPCDVPDPEQGPGHGTGICPDCTRAGYGYPPDWFWREW